MSAGQGPMSKQPTYGAAANREKSKSDLIHISSSCASPIMPAMVSKPALCAGAAWCSAHDTRVFATRVSDSCTFALTFCTHFSKTKGAVYPGKALGLQALSVVV